MIDDNRNNLGQLGVRKRTCFVVNSNYQQLDSNYQKNYCSS